ncbi:MAG: bifunctional 5,10-methylenetetrahydrofolate dehydrogenase/5,10-methenyltetrahydrofolate cyclohydrolase, partial [Pirellula sp.]
MTARILDGKAIAMTIRQEVAARVSAFRRKHGIAPKLVAVVVGQDPASQVYVRNKEIACQKAGLDSHVLRLDSSTTTATLLALLDQVNQDSSVHGILVQLPLPEHIDSRLVLDRIDPLKDVDAFSPENVGLMAQGRPRFLPCTPHGVLQLLARTGIEICGKQVVVVGRSDIVGKPLVNMCLQKTGPGGPSNANATVTCCHSQTQDLPSITRTADVLLVAIGKPNFITAQMVKPGAIVIDVGINRLVDQLVGDVDFEAVSQVASAITPVPGGVGPLTIAM